MMCTLGGFTTCDTARVQQTLDGRFRSLCVWPIVPALYKRSHSIITPHTPGVISASFSRFSIAFFHSLRIGAVALAASVWALLHTALSGRRGASKETINIPHQQ